MTGSTDAPNYRAFADPDAAGAWLKALGGVPDAAIDLTGACLALAALERPWQSLDREIDHLARLADDLRGSVPAAGLPVEERAEAIAGVLHGRHDYRGDRESYDDLRNANLLAVIERRRGLPIALSVLWLHLARAMDWPAEGVNFPGHFLVRLSDGPERLMVDPFDDGRTVETGDLRALIKLVEGDDAELRPHHYAPAANRDILLRLQNNIKLRQIRAGRLDDARITVERMLLYAPDRAALWHALGVLNAETGRPKAALDALGKVAGLDDAGVWQRQVARLMQQLRRKLN
ncbi:MAG: transglutaminase-like domain-containing protein [Rhodospirillaceae bacterium]|nr:transglutaminase-like domain-containing protein [Rhodospirillaceae bacterium]